MAKAFKSPKVEIFSKGTKVHEREAENPCATISVSIGSEKSPDDRDCGAQETVCPSGWNYYSSSYGACGPGCWRHTGGTQVTCGYTGWSYTAASTRPKLQHQWRHVATILERDEAGEFQEVDRWESDWFCYRTAAQIAEYNEAKPSYSSFPTLWCNPETSSLCGNPCEGEEGWCCLDFRAIEAKLRQLATAANAIKDLILGG